MARVFLISEATLKKNSVINDNVDNMYVQYEALGPNNVISDIYNQVRALPSIAPGSQPTVAHAIEQ